jgi:hypothetical protein
MPYVEAARKHGWAVLTVNTDLLFSDKEVRPQTSACASALASMFMFACTMCVRVYLCMTVCLSLCKPPSLPPQLTGGGRLCARIGRAVWDSCGG